MYIIKDLRYKEFGLNVSIVHNPKFDGPIERYKESPNFEVFEIKNKNMGEVKTKEIGGMIFKDISNEDYRVYEFPEKNVRIDKPLWLNYNPKSGGHRVLDSNNIAHYIPAGWVHLYWSSPEVDGGFSF